MLNAINKKDMLVQLDDGRIFPISGLYTNRFVIDEDTKTDDWNEAVVFVVDLKIDNTVLIVDVDSFSEGMIQ